MSRSARIWTGTWLALLLLVGGSASAAPLRPGEPPVWVAVEALLGEPGAVGSRGGGAGLRIGYRLNDQLSTAAGFATLFTRGGPVTLLAAGIEATLDATPIAPFLELSVLRADPVGRTGFTLAQRSGFGADFKIKPGVALGAVVRYVTPLDAEGALLTTGLAGLEFGLRFVFTPAVLFGGR